MARINIERVANSNRSECLGLRTTSAFHAAIVAMAIVAGVMPESVSAGTLAIYNVNIVSAEDTKPEQTANVFIENGRIAAIGAKRYKVDKVIDGAGGFLIPGLIDSHVHLEGVPGYRSSGDGTPDFINEAVVQIPRNYLYFGFTTVLDLASSREFISAWNAQTVAPDAHFCIAAPIANGYPLSWMPKEHQFHSEAAEFLLYDERQADVTPAWIKPEEHSPPALAKRIKDEGALCIKTFYETGFGPKKGLPVPSEDMIKALVDAARTEGLQVFLHGNSEQSYEFALNTGVGALAHGMWHWDKLNSSDERALSSFVSRIIQSEIAVQPTIQVIHGERELFNPEFFSHPNIPQIMPAALIEWYRSEAGQWMKARMSEEFGDHQEDDPEQLYQTVVDAYQQSLGNVTASLRLIAQSDGKLIFGSDTPSGPFYTQYPGLNGRWEMQRWLEADVSLTKLFNALTIDNARAIGLEQDIGSVAVGKVANLLLLKENPLKSISAYDSIQTVILHGKPIARRELSALAN